MEDSSIKILDVKIDSLLEVNRELLQEIKRQGDVIASQMQSHSRELNDLENGLNFVANTQKTSLEEFNKHKDAVLSQIQSHSSDLIDLGNGLGVVANAQKASLEEFKEHKDFVKDKLDDLDDRLKLLERTEQGKSGADIDAWCNKKIAWVAVGIAGPALGILGTKIVESLIK